MNIFFWRIPSAPASAASPPLRGVNLGGWLVLEKWMTPALFAGLKATDEYTLCAAGGIAIQSGLRAHRDSFITKADFVWLKDHGIDAVRLPVGYWTFGDEPPYMGTIEYVDRAFAWAQETGIKVLLDMHAAPGSQNGWDHSGRSGACSWHSDEQNIIKTLEVVRRLARRYGRHAALLGIELLNEPKWTVPRGPLLCYYEAAYAIVRKECGPDAWVVFSDGFRPRRWKRKLRGPGYDHVYMDTHQYQTFNKRDKALDIAGHLHKTLRQVPRELSRMRRRHNIIVGEWSLALDGQSLRGLGEDQVAIAQRAYGAAQLLAYHQASAWFYWNYKTESGGVWSYRDCIEQGLLP
jgi:glucan 1,3-beta-glucosidase